MICGLQKETIDQTHEQGTRARFNFLAGGVTFFKVTVSNKGSGPLPGNARSLREKVQTVKSF